MQHGETMIQFSSTVKPRCFLVPKVAFPHRPCRCGVDNETILAESKGSSCRLDVCFGMPDLWYNFLVSKFRCQKTPKGVVQLDLSTGDFSHFWAFVKLKFDKSDSSTNLIVEDPSFKSVSKLWQRWPWRYFVNFAEVLCHSTAILNPKEFTIFFVALFPEGQCFDTPKYKHRTGLCYLILWWCSFGNFHFGGIYLTFVPRIQLKSIKVGPHKVCIERNIQIIALKVSISRWLASVIKCHCSFFFRKSLMSWYHTQPLHKPQVAWSEMGSEGDLFDLFAKEGQSKVKCFLSPPQKRPTIFGARSYQSIFASLHQSRDFVFRVFWVEDNIEMAPSLWHEMVLKLQVEN